ncbi:MAG: hypothetical protein WBB82_06405 [Limnothrix sp.]
MVEPVTLTASVIANLAFQKCLEAGAGELGKKFTAEAIAKMDALRKKLWDKLRGQNIGRLDQALEEVEQGDRQALPIISTFLETEMLKDPDFAEEIKSLALQINAGKLLDNSNMTQNVTGDGNTNIQAKAEQGGSNQNAQSITNNYYTTPPDQP